jgi:hypothetical protein
MYRRDVEPGEELVATPPVVTAPVLGSIPNSLLARSAPIGPGAAPAPGAAAPILGGIPNSLLARSALVSRGGHSPRRRPLAAAALQIQRDDTNPPVGPSVSSATGGAVDLQAVIVSFTLPERKVLSSSASRNLTTTAPTTIQLKVSAQDVEVTMSPPIYIDAQWPAQNMVFSSVTYTFANHHTDVGVSTVNDEWGDGFIDVTETARESITELMNGIFAGTPFSPGRPIGAGPPPPAAPYNPMTDTDLRGTAEGIQMAFSQLPSSGDSDVGLGDVGDVSAGAVIVVKSVQEAGAGAGKVHIAAGTSITVMAHGAAGAKDLMAAAGKGSQAAANAAKIQSITITSSGIIVQKDGEDVIALDSISIHRGGKVTLDSFALLGKAKEAASSEHGLWFLIGAGINVAQGAPPELGTAIAAEDPRLRAQIVPGIAKDMVEEALNKALTDLLGQHGRDIPGVDLGEVLGVPGAPVPAGKP